MRVIGGEMDDDDGYVGRRRASWHRGSSPKGPDELDFEQDGRRPWGLSRAVQLFVIVVVSLAAAVLGMKLGLSSGDGAGAGTGAGGTHGVAPPSFTLPAVLPSVSVVASGPPGPQRTPASSSPAATTQVRNPPPALAPLVVDNFDGSPPWSISENDLGGWTGADRFANGGGNGNGVVGAGGLTLVYRDDGWFGSDVSTDVSTYRYLVLRITGAVGGEQRHFKLALGGVTKLFAEFTLDGGMLPVISTSYQDIRIPMAVNGINTRQPGELELSFWWGGKSTIVIDEIRFE